MAKFKVGDKVRVKEDLVGDKYYLRPNGSKLRFAPDMLKYRGQVYTIASVNDCDDYTLEGVFSSSSYFNHRWYFCDSMLEPVSVGFTKADLKDGMVVEIRDNSRNPRYMVLGDKIKGPNEYMELSSFEDDLTHTYWDDHCKRYDIVKVYKSYSNIIGEYFDDHHLKLIWERPKDEHKEMTVAEIEEKLGYKIKVIADKE